MSANEQPGTASSHPGDRHDIPETQPHASALDTLKARITQHYDLASTYYYSLWGQHIHHGLFTNGCTTKEAAQANLVDFMLEFSAFPQSGANVLDVGCGLGGTSRYLAQHRSATVTGITISSQQVILAQKITAKEAASAGTPIKDGPFHTDSQQHNTKPEVTAPANEDPDSPALSATPYHAFGPSGHVRFLHLDAEQMHNHLAPASYTHIWITEALSHIPNKALVFNSAFSLLAPSTPTQPSRLIIADWFRGPPESFILTPNGQDPDTTPNTGLSDAQLTTIAQIEDGMLLPTLPTIASYISCARASGFVLASPSPSLSFSSTRPSSAPSNDKMTTTNPVDISESVAPTWDISWSLISSPSLWSYAISQGRDGLTFLQSFRAMRRGYQDGSLRYGVLVLEKPVGAD